MSRAYSYREFLSTNVPGESRSMPFALVNYFPRLEAQLYRADIGKIDPPPLCGRNFLIVIRQGRRCIFPRKSFSKLALPSERSIIHDRIRD